jgi:hypothetical protein
VRGGPIGRVVKWIFGVAVGVPAVVELLHVMKDYILLCLDLRVSGPRCEPMLLRIYGPFGRQLLTTVPHKIHRMVGHTSYVL